MQTQSIQSSEMMLAFESEAMIHGLTIDIISRDRYIYEVGLIGRDKRDSAESLSHAANTR